MKKIGFAALCFAALASLPAGAAEKVLFEDAQIRFVEVTRWPGQTKAAAVSVPSILLVDAAWPDLSETPADAEAARRESAGERVVPPDDRPYPWCRTQSPQAARTIDVRGSFPQHFYRIEYKRVDGKDYAKNWQTLYPWITNPVKRVPDLGFAPQTGAAFSKDWPFPFVYNAADAAPANHYLRYDDAHVQLLEVVLRAGEKENMHGHPYPSVFADDGGFSPVGAEYQNDTLLPNQPPPWGKTSAAPGGAEFPTCFAAVPESPHQVTHKTGAAVHFFRVHFKRVDGEEIKAQWRAWYPPG